MAVSVGVHVVAIPRLARAANTTPANARCHEIATREKHHRVVPASASQRPLDACTGADPQRWPARLAIPVYATPLTWAPNQEREIRQPSGGYAAARHRDGRSAELPALGGRPLIVLCGPRCESGGADTSGPHYRDGCGYTGVMASGLAGLGPAAGRRLRYVAVLAVPSLPMSLGLVYGPTRRPHWVRRLDPPYANRCPLPSSCDADSTRTRMCGCSYLSSTVYPLGVPQVADCGLIPEGGRCTRLMASTGR